MMTMPIIAAAIVVQPIGNEQMLEPSVIHEVEHALRRAAALESAQPSPVGTNAFVRMTAGMSPAETAIRLVSVQRQDGGWRIGTNDVTCLARAKLSALIGEEKVNVKTKEGER